MNKRKLLALALMASPVIALILIVLFTWGPGPALVLVGLFGVPALCVAAVINGVRIWNDEKYK